MPNAHPHLRNPPIIEALVDIQVEAPAEVGRADLSRVHEHLRTQYATAHPIVQHKFQVSGGESPSTSHSSEAQGVQLLSEDRHWLSRALHDQLTVSRVNGYEHWDELIDHVRRVWLAYRSVTKPQNISRVAVRYVNRIEVPIPTEIDRHFTLKPTIPSGLPQSVTELFSRVVLSYPDDRYAALTLVSEPSLPNAATATFVLDVDVFANRRLSAENDDLWTVLDGLHEIKNSVFFASITPDQVERYR